MIQVSICDGHWPDIEATTNRELARLCDAGYTIATIQLTSHVVEDDQVYNTLITYSDARIRGYAAQESLFAPTDNE